MNAKHSKQRLFQKILRVRGKSKHLDATELQFTETELELLIDARREGLIEGVDHQPSLTQAGVAWLRRALSCEDPYLEQHQDRQPITMPNPTDESLSPVVRNMSESPLLWLRQRRDKFGKSMISDVELLAGERLAADLRRGALTQGLSRGWSGGDVKVDGGLSPGDSHLTDTAMVARRRAMAALDELGPQLAAAAVDVCHYEFGLTDIEKRRGWPARSAKLVIQIALNRLARHYGLEAPTRSRTNADLRR